MADKNILRQYGLRLLTGEKVEYTFDPSRGMTEGFARIRESGFILTSARLAHIQRGRSRTATLRDVSFLDVEHQGRNPAWFLLGLVLIAVGAIAYVLSDSLTEMVEFVTGESNIAIYVGGGFLGAALLAFWAFLESGETALATQIGGETLKVRVPRSMIGAATDFSTVFFQRKNEA